MVVVTVAALVGRIVFDFYRNTRASFDWLIVFEHSSIMVVAGVVVVVAVAVVVVVLVAVVLDRMLKVLWDAEKLNENDAKKNMQDKIRILLLQRMDCSCSSPQTKTFERRNFVASVLKVKST